VTDSRPPRETWHGQAGCESLAVPSSLLALLDDITTVLDDVAALTQVATKKTAGVLGDDLALNAQQVAGVKPDRELPVVWAVAKGSALNKLILVPIALAISALAPWAVLPLLMIGGAFLCFEGFEKIAHRLLHSKAEDAAEHKELIEAVADPAVDLVAFERDKIKGAIRTDFILSAEIIVIALGTVTDESFAMRLAVLAAISIAMTIGVYGLVAGIVKLDDAGHRLSRRASSAARSMGRALLAGAPLLMKFLSVAGTAAMFLVGGSILVHGIPPLHHAIAAAVTSAEGVATVGSVLGFLTSSLLELLTGVVAGGLVVAAVTLVKRLRRPARP
jgi:predicted DNA repair protein MutK